ncbi:MAG: hypothetical protein IJ583_09145 [Firmicutes bacterium]|nr:hypothetical protein [Bacillota bacterium]
MLKKNIRTILLILLLAAVIISIYIINKRQTVYNATFVSSSRGAEYECIC